LCAIRAHELRDLASTGASRRQARARGVGEQVANHRSLPDAAACSNRLRIGFGDQRRLLDGVALDPDAILIVAQVLGAATTIDKCAVASKDAESCG